MRRFPRPWLALLLGMGVLAGCQTPRNTGEEPRVVILPAAPLHFRGGNSPAPDKPGDTDCNSPAHWEGGTMYVFNSSGHPWRSSGRDLFHLDGDYLRCEYDNRANGGRWVECTAQAADSKVYGWYHFEPAGICPDTHRGPGEIHLTAPRIGAVKSGDNGANWQDLGIVLDAPTWLNCGTSNTYFAGGNGDFSAMLDQTGEFLYLFFSQYWGEAAQQGVGVARMRWSDRDGPAGKVSKWHQGRWSEPGVGGLATPIFPCHTNWHRADANAFWGPSIHWNTHVGQYVILLNRSQDATWAQEGVYISFNPDLSNPAGWSAPRKIMEPLGRDRWYPQIIGTNAARQETDKLCGRRGRLFVRGLSEWEILFLRPGETP